MSRTKIKTGDITNGSITADKLSASAISDRLGYTPISSITSNNGSLVVDISGNSVNVEISENLDDRYYTEAEADSRFLNTSGGGMSGFLTLHEDPTNALHAVTKRYVDSIAQGLHIHAPSVAATPGTLASITGGTITYNNGTAGDGATLTVSGGTFSVIDGVNIATIGTRILVRAEANTAHNGVYTFTSSTVLTRATDFNTSTELAGGDFTFVQQGTLYNDTGWVMSDPVISIGTTAITFLQFSGAGAYTAGTGLTLNGTQFSHTDTSSIANIDNSGNTFIQDLVFDTFGHVTGATSATVSIPGTNIAEGARTSTGVPITSSTGTGTTLSAATTSLAGVMTSADKTKLDGIAAGATNVTNTNQLINGAGFVTGSFLPLSGGTMTGQLTMNNSSSIRQTTTNWTGDAGAGQGKLEYHANRWYINAGGDSALVCQFRRGGADVSNVDNNGVYNGTATSARYADLAEKYTTDNEYPVGTVIIVSESDGVECTQSAERGQLAVGVISEKPAYLMNSESTGQAVALKGRVPVRIVGPIKKGQSIMSSFNGLAESGTTNVIGIALQTNLDPEEKYVECIII